MKSIKNLLMVSVGCGCFGIILPASAQTWTQTSAPSTNWLGIASSADGTKLVVLSDPYEIYVSTNSGSTWQKATNGPELSSGIVWSSLAGSADGSIFVAAAFSWNFVGNGGIYVSTNSGIGWTRATPMSYLEGVTCSADGARMTVLDFGYGSLTSTNSGRTWTQNSTQYIAWGCIAGSADGKKLAASTFGYNTMLLSANSGATWSQHSGPNNEVFPMASSADGSRLAGVSRGTGIYTSTNSGATWISNAVPSAAWCSIASSADGTRLAAVATNGLIYTSTNSGAIWRSNSVPTNYWCAVASSADGTKLAAAVRGGGIYTSYTTPKPSLSATVSNQSLTFSWLVASTNFVLQGNPNLANASSWVTMTNTPVLNLTNLQNQIILSSPGSNVFYRLKTP
jgi:hypothetical protein